MTDVFTNPELKQYVDMDDALARVRGNKKIYRRMLGLLLKSTEFEAFEQSVAAQDYAKGSEAAHSIKGVAGNLSMPRLFDLSEQLMHQMREGAPDPDVLADFRQCVQKTKAFVEEVAAALDAGM